MGNEKLLVFSFDGGGTVGCVRYQSIELDYVSRWFSRHHLCEFNCPRKSQQLHFGLISAVIIGYFGLVTRVYAEVLLQSFYIIMDITGLYAWLRASEDGSGQVTEVKVLKGIQWLYAFFTWLLIGVAAYILLGFVNDAQQTLDAITFSVSATGMLLMIKRYQSQFVFWLLGNIFSILLWFRAGTHAGGDYAIFVMYCMYTFNSIFGMFNWLKIKNKMEKNR